MAVPIPAGLPVGRWKTGILLLLLALGAQAAATPEPKRVLLFHTFPRDGAPMNATAAAFRRALAERSTEPIAFYDADLESGQPTGSDNDAALVDLLRARFAGTRLDLIVTVGGPAARFIVRHRDELFDQTPMLLLGHEERIIADLPMRAGDSAVGVRSDAKARLEQILTLLPDTRRVVIILGDSPLERYWVRQLHNTFQPFEGRLQFEWLNGLRMDQIKQRVASLQKGSVIFAGMIHVDGAGIPLQQDKIFEELSAISPAPIFSAYESDFGHGVVGGSLIPQVNVGKTAADIAWRTLSGSAQEGPTVSIEPPLPPMYDWRALQHWNIDESRLPPGSVVMFHPPSLWVEHRFALFCGVVVVLLQAAFIAGLFLQRERLRRAERETLAMSGRLMTAHEDERRHLARELHDDITQRLARLSIDAAQLEMRLPQSDGPSVHSRLVRLGEDVHALSYRLHPSIVEDLGLPEALKAECDQLSRHEAIRVAVDIAEIAVPLPKDMALCLFRVAQEALGNVVRHARATLATVSLRRREDGIVLSVTDDGVGFDPEGSHAHFSLGHAGMRERVRLLHGSVRIDSAPGGGTSIIAWLPLEAST